MTAESGWRNDWRCPDGHEMRCVTVDKGATPMMLQCQIQVDTHHFELTGIETAILCMKTSMSQFDTHRWSDEPPEYEWFKRDPLPTDNEGARDHLERGGLALRRMSDGIEV